MQFNYNMHQYDIFNYKCNEKLYEKQSIISFSSTEIVINFNY